MRSNKCFYYVNVFLLFQGRIFYFFAVSAKTVFIKYSRSQNAFEFEIWISCVTLTCFRKCVSLSTLQSKQSVCVLELRAVLILQHVQCHLTALLHHPLLVLPVAL